MAVDLNGFVVFARVAELGSFTAAADTLGLSKSMVSRQVSQLEDELGVRLLNRTTRRISLTEAGAVVLECAQRIVAEAQDAAEDASCIEAAVRGTLRINAPMTFGIRQLGPVLPEFLARYPELTVALDLNDRRIDLIEEGFDVSVRISALTDSSLIARQLAPVQRYVVGAPSWLKKRGWPKRPADLASHDFLLYTLLARSNHLEMENAKGEREEVELRARMYCNNADAMLESLAAGLGLALVPDFICSSHLKSGNLVRALPDWTVEPLTLHVIYPHSRHVTAKVRAFVDFMVEKFGPGRAPWLFTDDK